MRRYNPLPAAVSKSVKQQNRPIVFSSPKLSLLTSKINSTSITKKCKSQSKEKSIHEIQSKLKPQKFSPSRIKSFDQSTSEQQSKNYSPTRDKNSPQNYFSVSSLLKSKQITLQNAKQSIKAQSYEYESKVMKIMNPFAQIKNCMKLVSETDINWIDIKRVTEQNLWQSYQGQIQNNKFHGYGNLQLINGNKFMGFFFQSQPSGHGTYYFQRDNKIIHGIWIQGNIKQIL